MAKKTRVPKGNVSLEKIEKRYRLRWTDVNGRDSFNLPFPVSKENDCKAEKIRAILQLDVTNRQIDTSHKKDLRAIQIYSTE